jgi:hypothetical protein
MAMTQPGAAVPMGSGRILHESFTDGAQQLLGARVVAAVTGARGQGTMQPFAGDPFKGLLSCG